MKKIMFSKSVMLLFNLFKRNHEKISPRYPVMYAVAKRFGSDDYAIYLDTISSSLSIAEDSRPASFWRTNQSYSLVKIKIIVEEEVLS